MAFFELRIYRPQPGKMDGWVKLMEEQIIPFQVSKGVVVCASFRGETDHSMYVWVRRFESEEQREAQYKAVYEDEWWKANIDPVWQDYHRLEDIVVTRLVATPRSPVQ